MMMSFTVAAMKFFGRKDGRGIHEFGAEVKGLTQADREGMAPMLTDALKSTGALTADDRVDVGTVGV